MTNRVLRESRRLALTTLAISLALVAAAPAGAAFLPVKRVVSPQYQTKNATTDASGADTATTRPHARQGSSAAWYQSRNARYQFPEDSDSSSESILSDLNPVQRAISVSVWSNKPIQIPGQIDRKNAISSSDARLLLRLGLGFGLAYVVFLAAWFWRTRNRTQSAARLVRF